MFVYNILMIVSFICFGMIAIIPWVKGGMNTKYADIVVPFVSVVCFCILCYQIYILSPIEFDSTLIPIFNLFTFK